MRTGSPFSLSSIQGTERRGFRSEAVESDRCIVGRALTRPGGEDDMMPVLDVGTGVGYLVKAFWLLMPAAPRGFLIRRGRPGEEERGSNAGRRDGAGRFTPAT